MSVISVFFPGAIAVLSKVAEVHPHVVRTRSMCMALSLTLYSVKVRLTDAASSLIVPKSKL